MSFFEILMLICFGVAWPFSIRKSFKSKSTAGKSFIFLIVVLIGYISGIVHKFNYSRDGVIFLYIINGAMVSVDIFLYYRNSKIEQEISLQEIIRNE